MQRTDMRERTIDCVEGKGDSLLRCISREIFGNEKNIGVLKEILINEFKENVKIYRPFIGEEIRRSCLACVGVVENNTGGFKKLSQFIKERIEDDLPCDELLLWLTCTYFQTPLYVLRVTDLDTSTVSSWTEYTQLRRRKRDQKKKTTFLKKCSSTYFISLLETEGKQYCRIVPKLKSCNCFLEIPSIPSVESVQCHTQQDRTLLKTLRNVDDLLEVACVRLNELLHTCRLLQQTCDDLINEFESRRKKTNIATTTGLSSGVAGVIIAGIGLSAVTAGASLGLSVGGIVLGTVGGTVVASSKIRESVLNKGTIGKLERYQNCYEERLEILKNVIGELKKHLMKLETSSEEMLANPSYTGSEFAYLQSLPGIILPWKALP
ncbi:uncharacterized protein LOC144622391 [Crassostrea virginica]